MNVKKKGNACDYWHPTECPFFTQLGVANLGVKCGFKHTGKAGSEPRNRNTLVVVNTVDLNQREDRITSLNSQRRGTFCCFPQGQIQKIEKNLVKKNTICERAREKSSNFVTTWHWTKQSKSECSVVRAAQKFCRFYRIKQRIFSYESIGK